MAEPEGQRQLAARQQSQKDPGRAHGDIGHLLEIQQDGRIDEVDEGRRADVGGIGLGGDDSLNPAPPVLEDDGAQHQHHDGGKNEHVELRGARQVDEDVGQVLDQPLAPQKGGCEPL